MAESTLIELNSTPTGPIVVFIARSSSALDVKVKREWLLETLYRVQQIHLEEYSSLDSRSVDFIPFIHNSNQPLPQSGEVMIKLSAVFQKARANAGCGVILVISGWDGLTTNDLTLRTLGGEAKGVDVTLRFCLRAKEGESYHFYDIKLRDACEVLSGDNEVTDETSSLRIFMENFKGIQASKQALSVAKKELNTHSFRRNTFERPENVSKWACDEPDCGELFKTHKELNYHQARIHKQRTDDAKSNNAKTDDTNTNCVACSFCHAKFTENWSRDRHVKISCPKNPDSEKNKPATKPRKQRGTMVRVAGVEDQPKGSDNGLKPYLTIDPADFQKAPRIDPENPIIYRGEVFCRHPDCASKKVTRYTQKSIVRKHYRKEHGMEYRQFSRTLGTFDEQPHIDGLQWISICVQRGQEQAGTAPVPRKW